MKGSVRKRGKRWYYYFNHEGKRIERVSGDTKSEALKALRQALTDVVDNNKSMVDAKLTVQDLIDKWMALYVEQNCRIQTIGTYRTVVAMLPDGMKKLKIDKLRPVVLQPYVNELYKEYKRSTANTIVGVLSSMFKYAINTLELLNTNPVEGINKPRDKNPDIDRGVKTYTKEEIEDIFDSLKLYHYSYTAVMLGYYLGLRAGEACALEWRDIDFDNKTVSISKSMIRKRGTGNMVGPPKTISSNRLIHAPNVLMSYLKKLKSVDAENRLKLGKYAPGFDFIMWTTRISCVGTSRLNDYLKKHLLGVVDDFKFHNLRHTHASMLMASGVNVVDIQERLGHSSPSITLDVYSHGDEDSAKAVATLLDDKFATF